MAVQTPQLEARAREALGTRSSRRIRQSGQLPGVVYGHKEAVVPVTLPGKETAHHLNHGVHLFDLNLDGKTEKVLVKEVQYDHLGLEILHVDLARVSLDERVEVTVPLELRGTPKGEADDGVLQQIISELEIECLVTDIPEVIRHDVSELGLDDSLNISDLKLPEGIKVLQDADQIVATVKQVQEEEEEEAVEGEAEPEVIGRKEEEEEPEEGKEQK